MCVYCDVSIAHTCKCTHTYSDGIEALVLIALQPEVCEHMVLLLGVIMVFHHPDPTKLLTKVDKNNRMLMKRKEKSHCLLLSEIFAPK